MFVFLAAKPDAGKSAGGSGKYVPPGARAGAKGRGETMSSKRGKIVGKGEVVMSLWVGMGERGWRRGVSGKYVPPGARAGAKGRGETMSSER